MAAGLIGWRRHVAAILLGALAAVALPPVDYVPVLLIAFPGLVWLDGRQRRRALGLRARLELRLRIFPRRALLDRARRCLVDAAQFWWLLPFAVLGVPAGLAIFTGTALLAAHAFAAGCASGGTGARCIVLAVAAGAGPNGCAAMS